MCGRTSSEREHAADAAEVKRQEVEHDQLCREGLRRRDTDFWARMRVDRSVAFARDHAADHVADRDAGCALASGLPESRQGVGRLARLRDDDGERSGIDDGLPVAILRAVVHLDRHGGRATRS